MGIVYDLFKFAEKIEVHPGCYVSLSVALISVAMAAT